MKKAKHTELIAVRVEAEQRWAYAQRMAHLSYNEMRVKSSRHPEDGGLGYQLSEHALKALVNGYLEKMREVHEVNAEELVTRELADLDMQQRRAAVVAELAAEALARAHELEALDVHAAKTLLDADAKARAIGESRRKLLGLDQPTRIEADITVKDGVLEELNAMLGRAGRKPIKKASE